MNRDEHQKHRMTIWMEQFNLCMGNHRFRESQVSTATERAAKVANQMLAEFDKTFPQVDVAAILEDKMRLLAQPAGEWTQTPPTKLGRYWMRHIDRPNSAQIVSAQAGVVGFCVMGSSTAVSPFNLTRIGVEFWTIPLTPPQD